MTRALVIAAVLAAGGCGKSTVPTAKYFGGKPVDDWLGLIQGADARTRKQAADTLGNVGPADPPGGAGPDRGAQRQ